MRLIDADELITGRVENDPVVIAAKCAPTAYDVDKVVEQIKNCNYCDTNGYLDPEALITIVKAGRLNE